MIVKSRQNRIELVTRPEQLQVQPLTVSQDASLSVAVIASVAASVADNLGDPETMGNPNPPSKHVNLFEPLTHYIPGILRTRTDPFSRKIMRRCKLKSFLPKGMSTIVDVTSGKVVMNTLGNNNNNVVVPPSSNLECPEMAEEDDLKTPTVEELAFPGQKAVCLQDIFS